MPTAIATDGAELLYDVYDFTDPWKSSSTIILQHGMARASEVWYSLIPYLSRWYKVVCPNLRGMGRSSVAFDLQTGISVDQYLSDVLAVADHSGAETFHFAGESIGGHLGMALAALHSKRVRTLTLISGTITVDQKQQANFSHGFGSWEEALRKEGALEWARGLKKTGATRFPDDQPDHSAWYSELMGRSNVDVLVAMSRVAREADAAPYLRKIMCPVLAYYPTTADPEKIKLLQSDVRRLTLVQFGPYHNISTLYPAMTGSGILSFISQHDGRVCREL
jgi:3-oxoadipate enol-lactonase